MGVHPTPLQKKIIVAGIDGIELSPQDIYQAMNSFDRDSYDREVTALRTSNILVETRSSGSATAMARKRRIGKKYIPRFKVMVPKESGPTEPLNHTKASPSESQQVKPLVRKLPVRPVLIEPTATHLPTPLREFGISVKNVAIHTTMNDLKTMFEQCGTIVRMKRSTNSRSVRFLWFDSESAQTLAIQSFDGIIFKEKALTVNKYVSTHNS